MLNRCLFMGRLTKDPKEEIKTIASGDQVLSFSVAIDRDYKDKETDKYPTDFLNFVAWRSTAKFIADYFKKGQMICLECKAQSRNWTDNDGKKRYVTEFIVERAYFSSDKPKGSEDGGSQTRPTDDEYSQDSAPSGFAEIDDDIPF